MPNEGHAALGGARRVVLFLFARLRSVHLTVILLGLLVLACAVGGTLPQSPTTPNADTLYRSYGVFWYRVITRLSLDDVFHSGWFIGLVGLFAVNLVLCTAGRVRRTIRMILRRPRFAPIGDGDENSYDAPSEDATADVASHTEQLLRRAGLRRIDRAYPSGNPEGGVQVVGRRHQWGVFGPDLVHSGILIILVGAALGVLRSESAFVVNEWEKGSPLPHCEEKDDACVPLAFEVRVDDFGVETYEESALVKSYWADLSFWDDGDLVRQSRISVNRPITIYGASFYPWRYGSDVQAARVLLHVFDRGRNAVVSDLGVQIGASAPVPGTQLRLTAVRLEGALAVDDQRNAVALDAAGNSLALLIQVEGIDEEGKAVEYRDSAFPYVPETPAMHRYVFLLAGAKIPASLELRVVQNPGYPVVWWGFVLVMTGLTIAFCFPPCEVRVTVEKGRVSIRAKGRGSRRRIQDLAGELRLHTRIEER